MNQELSGAYFMWKRELIRFFRSPSRVIGSLASPFFYLAILGTGLNGSVKLPGTTGNYLAFIAPGILAMVLLFGSIFSGIQVIMDRQFGFLKETLVAPIRRESIVFGKVAGGATTAIIQGLLVLFLASLLGVTVNWANIPMVVVIMALTSMSFVALGIAIASVMEDMQGFQLISNFLVMPMFFLSGALFPTTNAPALVQAVSMFDPLTYSVDAMRALLVGQSSMPLETAVAALTAFFLAAFFAGVYMFNKIEE